MESSTFGGLFKQAKESGALNSVLPDGDYVLRVASYSVKENAGKPDSIGLQLEAIQSTVDAAVGRKVWKNLYFTEKSLPVSYRFLTDLGLSAEFIENAVSAESVAQALVGVEFDTEVSLGKPWGKNGENVNNEYKIVSVLVPPAVGTDPPTVVGTSLEDEEPF